jgi:mitogen-activated protein kinase organizer 1
MVCDYIGEQVTCSTLSRDDQSILVSVLDNRLLLFDKITGQLLNEYKGHQNKCYSIESSMNIKCDEVISGSEDGYIYFWDLVEAKIKFRLKHDLGTTVHSLSYHPGENMLLSAQENNVYFWKQSQLN